MTFPRVPRAARAGLADESGFTLVELIVAIVILGLIMVPLTSAIIVGLLTTEDAQVRLSETQSAAISAAFWAGDVQSADGTVTVGGSAACATGLSGTITPIVTFRWADDISPTNAASYVARLDAGERSLVRVFCQGGTKVSSGTVAPVLSANPTVACTPTCVKPTTVTISMTTPTGFAFSLNGTRRSTS